jgi:type I restriction enzyme S subunit
VDLVSPSGPVVAARDYALAGTLPVVDQGRDFVGGYTDSRSAGTIDNVPVIVFGDHTRRVKYVDFPFAIGAQGTKVLAPRAGWDAKFLAYAVATCPLDNRGYGRHWAELRNASIPKPPLEEQRQIVSALEERLTRVEDALRPVHSAVSKLAALRLSVMAALHPSQPQRWRPVGLPDVTVNRDGVRVPVKQSVRLD